MGPNSQPGYRGTEESDNEMSTPYFGILYIYIKYLHYFRESAPSPYREYISWSFVNEYERIHALKSMRSMAKKGLGCT
jgi:hypothetical protein